MTLTNLFLILIAFNWAICYPIDQVEPNHSQKLIKFMQRFGYLEKRPKPSSGPEAEALYKQDAIVDAIRQVQKYGALPQTGVLDDKTIELINSPRCGVPDVESSSVRRKRYLIGSSTWKKRKITYFIANWSHKVPQEEIETKMKIAFKAWSQYSNLRFVRVNDTSADIIVAFGRGFHGDNYPFDGPGNVLAHAFYPYEEMSYGGDIHFDEDENWLEGAQSLSEGVDFLSVAVHELGHSLGLAHSPVWSSIMFPYYKGLTPAQLDYDDILAMYHLYIQKVIQDDSSIEMVTEQNATDGNDEEDQDSDENSEEVEVQVTDKLTKTTTVPSKVITEHEESSEIENESEEIEESQPANPSDLCSGYFDAVSFINSKIFVFKNEKLWVFNENFIIETGYPKNVSEVFPNLPQRFSKLDAVYEQKEIESTTIMIYLFSGQEYVSFDLRGPLYNGPYPLANLLNDPNIEKIDAAFIWARNNKTYLFSDEQYWRFDQNKIMDPHYPKTIEKWHGLPVNLDGAVTLPNGKSFFFKEKYYWLFNNPYIRPEKGYPRKISSLIPSCH